MRYNFIAVDGTWWRIDEWGKSIFGPVNHLTYRRVSNNRGHVWKISDMEQYLAPIKPSKR